MQWHMGKGSGGGEVGMWRTLPRHLDDFYLESDLDTSRIKVQFAIQTYTLFRCEAYLAILRYIRHTRT